MKLYEAKEIKFGIGDWQEHSRQMDHNFNRLMRLDWEAKQNGTLVGRVISHQFADGYAHYQIIKENKRTVVIKVCIGLGDDWILPAWGERATIEKNWAVNWLESKDRMDKAFGGHPADPHRKGKSIRVNSCGCEECKT